MNELKLILKEAGFSGLKWHQIALIIWFCISLFGLCMGDDAHSVAWLIVIVNLAVTGLLIKKYVPIKNNNN